MRTHNNVLFVLTILIMISGCAGGTIQMPQKYALEGQLEQVKTIYKYRIIEWEKVDNQSLIIETGPSDYYLLVLKIPSPELVFRNRIGLSSTGNMVRAGLDDLIIYNGAHMRSTYPIDRIFRIKGREQMRAVRDQLTGSKDIPKKSPAKPRSMKNEGAEI
jgi:hypothetical protein